MASASSLQRHMKTAVMSVFSVQFPADVDLDFSHLCLDGWSFCRSISVGFPKGTSSIPFTILDIGDTESSYCSRPTSNCASYLPLEKCFSRVISSFPLLWHLALEEVTVCHLRMYLPPWYDSCVIVGESRLLLSEAKPETII